MADVALWLCDSNWQIVIVFNAHRHYPPIKWVAGDGLMRAVLLGDARWR